MIDGGRKVELRVQPGVALEFGDAGERRVVDPVDLAGLDRDDAGVIVGDVAEVQFGRLRQARLEVGGVGFHHELLALLPVDQHEGPRAHRLVGDLVLRRVFEDLFGQHAVGEERDVRQERGPRLFQRHDDGEVAAGEDLLDGLERPLPRSLDVMGPLERPDHVAGLDRVAGGEAGIPPQREGPRFAVGGRRPPLGKVGVEAVALDIDPHQLLVDLHEGPDIGIGVLGDRVEVFGRPVDAEPDRLLELLRRRVRCGHARERQA